MIRQPRGDTTTWDAVLSHRADEARIAAVERFEACGLAPVQVEAVLEDGGDSLHAAAARGAEDWTDDFGGPLAVALLAAEVSALAAHLNSRASSVRAQAVNNLLDDYSAVTVAARLGVSRQKVYEIVKSTGGAFIDLVPWRRP
ncbi:MAG TPA: hypothetical protein VIA06_21445 [Candidatus Dormibacteraeota bacterium]|nr:hypothetical protein [Candidatus Dormibacteraeota bacterium]